MKVHPQFLSPNLFCFSMQLIRSVIFMWPRFKLNPFFLSLWGRESIYRPRKKLRSVPMNNTSTYTKIFIDLWQNIYDKTSLLSQKTYATRICNGTITNSWSQILCYTFMNFIGKSTDGMWIRINHPFF